MSASTQCKLCLCDDNSRYKPQFLSVITGAGQLVLLGFERWNRCATHFDRNAEQGIGMILGENRCVWMTQQGSSMKMKWEKKKLLIIIASGEIAGLRFR